MTGAKGSLDGPAVDVERVKKLNQPLGSESDRRKSRDLLWLLQYRDGWKINKIAFISGVHPATVYRRIRQMEAIANGR